MLDKSLETSRHIVALFKISNNDIVGVNYQFWQKNQQISTVSSCGECEICPVDNIKSFRQIHKNFS